VTPLPARAFMDSDRFSGMQSQPTSAGDHGCYNKSNTYRSCVITVYQFRLHISIHVRDILSFFSKEKEVASLILRAYTHTHHYTLAVSLCPSHYIGSYHVRVHHHTSSLPASLSHYTSSLPVLVHQNTPTVFLYLVHPSFLFDY